MLREPLLHFLLVGGLLFAADAVLNDAALPAEPVIRISEEEVAGLQARWLRQYQRPPAPEELRGLIDDRVREEVLYREALAMGLDRDDSIVRRRLAQKLEFLVEDVAAARAPSEAELAAFFAEHQERYRLPARVSFSHLYFSPSRRGPAAEADARLVLAGLGADLQAGAASDPGDGFLPGQSFDRLSAEEVAAVFGPEFAQAVNEVEPGAWAGPIASAYGWHLVRVNRLSQARLPALDEVADRVRQDWAYAQQRQANEAVFAQLLARYEVVIETGGSQRLAHATPDTEARP